MCRPGRERIIECLAVVAAEELKPDLILLDIGLPKLNGLQAALQIQQVAPNSEILFLEAKIDLGTSQKKLYVQGHTPT